MSESNETSLNIAPQQISPVDSSEQASPPTENIKNATKIDRRKFMGIMGRLGAGIAASVGLGSSASPSNEVVEPAATSVTSEAAEILKPNEKRLVIDFFDLSTIDQLIEQHLALEKKTLQDVLQSMGIENPSDLQSIRSANPKNESEEKIILLLALKNRYASHGDIVVDIGRKVSEDLGVDYQEPEKKDATSALKMKDLSHDKVGNPILHLFISDQMIEEMVEDSEARDVGLSLETGEFAITFKMYDTELVDPLALMKPKPSSHEVMTKDSNGNEIRSELYSDAQGNKISKEEYDLAMQQIEATHTVTLEPKDRDLIIEDGYLAEHAYENLLRMVNLAEKFPEKNFFVAGGNPRFTKESRPDIREARKKIIAEKGKMPENLTVVGAKGQTHGVDYAASLGCDIYVDETYLEKIGLNATSSWATPVVKEIASTLADKGLDTFQVSSGLRLMTNSISADGGIIDILSMEKAKALLQFIK